MSDYTLKIDGLEKLIKSFKVKPPVAKVGILGNGESKGLTNATIGAAHEFGTTVLPQRSFLRMPLTQHLDKELESSDAFNEDLLKRVVAEKRLDPWVEVLGVLAVGVVMDAFHTEGFGQWPPSDMTHKTVKQTLTETGQLRDSISYEVVSG